MISLRRSDTALKQSKWVGLADNYILEPEEAPTPNQSTCSRRHKGCRTVLLGSLGCWLHDSAVVLGDEVDHDGRALPSRTSRQTRTALTAANCPRNLVYIPTPQQSQRQGPPLNMYNENCESNCRDGRIQIVNRVRYTRRRS